MNVGAKWEQYWGSSANSLQRYCKRIHPFRGQTSFSDKQLKFDTIVAKNESYSYRTYTVPGFSVFPWVVLYLKAGADA